MAGEERSGALEAGDYPQDQITELRELGSARKLSARATTLRPAYAHLVALVGDELETCWLMAVLVGKECSEG